MLLATCFGISAKNSKNKYFLRQSSYSQRSFNKGNFSIGDMEKGESFTIWGRKQKERKVVFNICFFFHIYTSCTWLSKSILFIRQHSKSTKAKAFTRIEKWTLFLAANFPRKENSKFHTLSMDFRSFIFYPFYFFLSLTDIDFSSFISDSKIDQPQPSNFCGTNSVLYFRS